MIMTSGKDLWRTGKEVVIIHKDVLEAIQRDYVRRIEDGTLNLEELKGMFEVQVKLLEEYQRSMTEIQHQVLQLQESFDEVAIDRDNMKIENSNMLRFLEKKTLVGEYRKFNLERAKEAVRADWFNSSVPRKR